MLSVIRTKLCYSGLIPAVRLLLIVHYCEIRVLNAIQLYNEEVGIPCMNSKLIRFLLFGLNCPSTLRVQSLNVFLSKMLPKIGRNNKGTSWKFQIPCSYDCYSEVKINILWFCSEADLPCFSFAILPMISVNYDKVIRNGLGRALYIPAATIAR